MGSFYPKRMNFLLVDCCSLVFARCSLLVTFCLLLVTFSSIVCYESVIEIEEEDDKI